MRTLYHWPLDPSSRQVRLALGEKKIKFSLETVNPTNPSELFLTFCTEGIPPCLVEDTGGQKIIISTARAICEYAADDPSGRSSLLPNTAKDRAEARRLTEWFDVKFAHEVQPFILSEKLAKNLGRADPPDPNVLRQGRENLKSHLEYISWILENRSWLAGSNLSLADLAAGGHFSCLDYLNEIQWDKWPHVKSWYQKLKSRPSFRPLLKELIPGLRPPRHYSDLDF